MSEIYKDQFSGLFATIVGSREFRETPGEYLEPLIFVPEYVGLDDPRSHVVVTRHSRVRGVFVPPSLQTYDTISESLERTSDADTLAGKIVDLGIPTVPLTKLRSNLAECLRNASDGETNDPSSYALITFYGVRTRGVLVPPSLGLEILTKNQEQF